MKYRALVPMSLSPNAAEWALSETSYEPPCLYVGKGMMGLARRIAKILVINYKRDDSLDPNEWYVEWKGERVGSIGC